MNPSASANLNPLLEASANSYFAESIRRVNKKKRQKTQKLYEMEISQMYR